MINKLEGKKTFIYNLKCGEIVSSWKTLDIYFCGIENFQISVNF